MLFFIASITPLGNRILISVPDSLKHGITAGIGLIITFTGLQKGEIIQPNENTLAALGDFGNPVALSTIVGLVITLILFVRNFKGSLLIGLFFTSILTFVLTGGAEIANSSATFTRTVRYFLPPNLVFYRFLSG